MTFICHLLFAGIYNFRDDADFVVVCDDKMMQLQPDTVSNPPDPRGIWVDSVHVHGWSRVYDLLV